MLGAIAVTLPSVYYLWPASSQGHAHHPPIHAIDPSSDDSSHQAQKGGVSAEDTEDTEEPEQAPSKESDEAAADANADKPEQAPSADADKAAEDANTEEPEQAPSADSDRAAASANDPEKDSQKPGDGKPQDMNPDELPPQSGKTPDLEAGEKLSKRTTDGKNMPEGKGDVEGVQFKGRTNMGDSDNKMPDERKIEDDSKGGKKKRIDSGYGKDLGEGPAKREDGSETVRIALFSITYCLANSRSTGCHCISTTEG